MQCEPIEPSETHEMKAWFLPFRSKKQKTRHHDLEMVGNRLCICTRTDSTTRFYLGARCSQRKNVISSGIVGACQLEMKETLTFQRVRRLYDSTLIQANTHQK